MTDGEKKRKKRHLPDTGVSASFTECTGLMPTPPQDADEDGSYRELFSTELPENEEKE